MEDRREDILRKNVGLIPFLHIEKSHDQIYNAMGEYMRDCVLEFIDFVAKNKIEINNFNGEVSCYLPNGEGISKEQLFENFL